MAPTSSSIRRSVYFVRRTRPTELCYTCVKSMASALTGQGVTGLARPPIRDPSSGLGHDRATARDQSSVLHTHSFAHHDCIVHQRSEKRARGKEYSSQQEESKRNNGQAARRADCPSKEIVTQNKKGIGAQDPFGGRGHQASQRKEAVCRRK